MRMVLVLAVLGGCAMSSSSGGIDDAMRDAQNEEQLHVTQARAAPDLPSLVSEVDRHSAHMTVILDDMRDDMTGMQHCAGMTMMMDMREGMQTEVDQHHATMHAMTDMTAARQDEEHHISVMDGMLGDMGMQLGGMHCGGM